MKKKFYIIIVILVFLLLLFGILYYNGLFIKENYSGLVIYRIDVVKNHIIIDELSIEDEYNLQLTKNEKIEIEIGSGWTYDIKYFNAEKQFPIIEYKNCNYTIYKDGEIYLSDDDNIDNEHYIKSSLIDESNFFISKGYALNSSIFNFSISESGKYEVIIDLNIYINDVEYSETKKIKFNIN